MLGVFGNKTVTATVFYDLFLGCLAMKGVIYHLAAFMGLANSFVGH